MTTSKAETVKTADLLKEATSNAADNLDAQASDAIHTTEHKAHQVIDAGVSTAHKVEQRWNGLKDSAQAGVKEARTRAATVKSTTENNIQSSPWRAVGIAAGLGALSAFLLHKSKK